MTRPIVTPQDFRTTPRESEVPWVVRVALALHDYGRPLPPHLLMAVQMLRNGDGCAGTERGARYWAHGRHR